MKELASNQIAEAQRIHQYQEAQKQQQQEQTKQQFRQYAEYHDSRVPAVSNLPEVQREIMAMAQEHGIAQQELMELYEKSPVVRHSAFQAMMLDAAQIPHCPEGHSRSSKYGRRPRFSDRARATKMLCGRVNTTTWSGSSAGKDLSPKEAARLVIARRGAR